MSNYSKLKGNQYTRRNRQLNLGERVTSPPESPFETQRRREQARGSDHYFQMPSVASMLQTLATSSNTLSRVANAGASKPSKEKPGKKIPKTASDPPYKSNKKKPTKASNKSQKKASKCEKDNVLRGEARTMIFKENNNGNIDFPINNDSNVLPSDIDSDDYEDEFIPTVHNKPKPVVPVAPGRSNSNGGSNTEYCSNERGAQICQEEFEKSRARRDYYIPTQVKGLKGVTTTFYKTINFSSCEMCCHIEQLMKDENYLYKNKTMIIMRSLRPLDRSHFIIAPISHVDSSSGVSFLQIAVIREMMVKALYVATFKNWDVKKMRCGFINVLENNYDHLHLEIICDTFVDRLDSFSVNCKDKLFVNASDMVRQITDGYNTHTDDYDNIIEKLFSDEKKANQNKSSYEELGEPIYDDLDYFDREDPKNDCWNIANLTNDVARYSVGRAPSWNVDDYEIDMPPYPEVFLDSACPNYVHNSTPLTEEQLESRNVRRSQIYKEVMRRELIYSVDLKLSKQTTKSKMSIIDFITNMKYRKKDK